MTFEPVASATRKRQSGEVIIVHTDAVALMSLAAPLAAMRYEVVGVDSVNAMDSAQRVVERRPRAMIIALAGAEDVADVEALMSSARWTKILLLVPETPPAASLRTVARAQRAATVRCDESSAVVLATLVALLADAPARTQRVS